MTAEPECHEEFWDNGRLKIRSFQLNGMLHRTDEPAWEEWNENGCLIFRKFCVNGKRHNENGPAWEERCAKGRLIFREFWVNGMPHRPDGPAVEWWGDGARLVACAFYVNGEELTKKAFLAWQLRQRQRELAALVFALEHKIPATAPEREFLRHILPAFVAASRPCELNQ